MISQFQAEGAKYRKGKSQWKSKSTREIKTLEILAKFKNKLRTVNEMSTYNEEDEEGVVKEDSGEDSETDDGW